MSLKTQGMLVTFIIKLFVTFKNKLQTVDKRSLSVHLKSIASVKFFVLIFISAQHGFYISVICAVNRDNAILSRFFHSQQQIIFYSFDETKALRKKESFGLFFIFFCQHEAAKIFLGE